MDISTSWIKPPTTIGGLDHLAVQAPCINLYGRMLPGITNVTDRSRYYSFYPWVVWSLEKRGHVYGDTFIDMFRKADCLFTLIAERHAKVAGGDREDHAGATVGSGNMGAQIARVRDGQPIVLSQSSHREGENRYFKNKLGGLGQYYIGVFRELNLMTGDLQAGIKNIREVGGVIADALERHVNSDLFFKTIAEDTVSASRLDELHSFCLCLLHSSPEEHARQSIGQFSSSDMDWFEKLLAVDELFYESYSDPSTLQKSNVVQPGDFGFNEQNTKLGVRELLLRGNNQFALLHHFNNQPKYVFQADTIRILPFDRIVSVKSKRQL